MLRFKQFEKELLMSDILELEELTGINIFFASSFLSNLEDEKQSLIKEYNAFKFDYFDELGHPLKNYSIEELNQLALVEYEFNKEIIQLDIKIRFQTISEGIELINYIFPEANIGYDKNLDYNLIVDFKNDLKQATAAKLNISIPGTETGSDKKKQL